MKIISWNCNGKFREKFKVISKENADLYIIQECENPNQSENSEYKNFAKNCFWVGDIGYKGLGIFSKENIKLTKNDWKTYCLKNFISVNVNNEFNLVGVWACERYIEEYYLYQNINIENYNDNTIIIGDFNSNKSWDKKHGDRNHSAVVNELKEKNLISAYHYVFSEEQGKESQNTFYLYRHLDKGYHIDYCFIKKERIKKFQILPNTKEWLAFSDHIPIILEI